MEHCFVDHLKAPGGNPPKSAKLSPASFNIYMGKDVPGTEMVDETVECFAYAQGTGAITIGIDPEIACLYPWNAFCDKLVDWIRNDGRLLEEVWNADYNSVSVKAYYRYTNPKGTVMKKNTGYHCDVNWKAPTNEEDELDNPPQRVSNSSQVPGTPVPIFTFGTQVGKKDLSFQATGIRKKDRTGPKVGSGEGYPAYGPPVVLIQYGTTNVEQVCTMSCVKEIPQICIRRSSSLTTKKLQ